MPAYLNDLYTALRTAVAASMPETVANGIWEAEHLDMLAWEAVTPPLASIVLGDVTYDDSFALDVETYRVNAEIYYVADVAGGSSAIRTKLETLRDYLYTTGLTIGQVLWVEELNWGRDYTTNEVFAEKRYKQRTGRLIVEISIGNSSH